ncbi:MAG: hypothetical protein DMF95_05090 [Acidobacteria bacterium]|nr:MAG: hypothetical protein DMF95_05090 [Acidobacteriota bacterium]
MIEENFDIGGHGMVSGGNVHLGGGTSRQKKFGIQDSPDQVFNDWGAAWQFGMSRRPYWSTIRSQ